MKSEEEYLKNIDQLLPRPDTALDVLEMAHRDDCSIPVLAARIEQDPGLTANMLKLANSAFFGQVRKIATVHDIIVRLGMDSVRMIAITGASIGLLRSHQQAYNLDPGMLWRHSQATATLASIIAQTLRVRDSSVIYTAALLHDIGKVVLNRPLQLAMLNAGAELSQEQPFIEVERKLLNTDHEKLGMFLLEKWGLPSAITVPVGFHHEWEKALIHKAATRIVAVANRLVEGMGFLSQDLEGFDADDYVDEEIYRDLPGFRENMETIIEQFHKRMHDSATLTFE
ncbi:MAG: HDOD domain-containing protein [Thermodesulfobacteriota bacterium]